jgi:hypothetical protein
VDTTKGTVESSGFDITLPGLPAFDRLVSSVKFFPPFDAEVVAQNSITDQLHFAFSTFPISGSLVGFHGGPKSVLPGVDTFGNYGVVEWPIPDGT